jgi:hypothetical protein
MSLACGLLVAKRRTRRAKYVVPTHERERPVKSSTLHFENSNWKLTVAPVLRDSLLSGEGVGSRGALVRFFSGMRGESAGSRWRLRFGRHRAPQLKRPRAASKRNSNVHIRARPIMIFVRDKRGLT